MSDSHRTKKEQRKVRHIRIRANISGTTKRPRLSVYRSNAFIYAQLVDDASGKTIFAVSDMKIAKGNKMEKAIEVGKLIATKANEMKITEVVFDRGGFLYAGRIKALADSARSNGLKF